MKAATGNKTDIFREIFLSTLLKFVKDARETN